ncbi:MAG: sulfatase [Phycisphaerales bacterium]|nr:sulfatase [Phycisphaerales bacterium]
MTDMKAVPRHSIRRRVAFAAFLLGVPTIGAILFFPDVSRLDQRDKPRPDILLVTFDTLRADHCSLYGYARATTPNLARLAGDGVTFDLAYSPMATTAPAHASIMTGLYPLGHGVLRNGFVLPEGAVTLAEALKKEGYTTAAFVSSFVLYHKFGLAQGFDLYDDDFSKTEGTQPQAEAWEGVDVPGRKVDRRADAVTDRAIAWLNEVRPARRVPIFVWVHYMDPHEPYAPPASFGDPFGIASAAKGSLEEAVARYDTEIAFMDREFGRLLKAFDGKTLREGSWVIAAADHGESFMEHGWRGHGTQVYEESVRVPLVMRWTGRLPRGLKIESPVGLHDLAPTVAAALSLPRFDGPHVGINLAPLWATPPLVAPDRPLFFQRRSYEQDGLVEAIPLHEMDGAVFGSGVEVRGQKFAVRVGAWKFFEASEELVARELYELAADAGELKNVAGERIEIAGKLSRMIAEFRKDHRLARGATVSQTVSPQDQAMLKGLGYTEPEPP